MERLGVTTDLISFLQSAYTTTTYELNIVAPNALSTHLEAYDKAVRPLHAYGQFSSQR